MVVVVCKVCAGKKFKNEEAYLQHARDNKRHKELQGQAQPPTTLTTSHPIDSLGYCKSCRQDFRTSDGLQAHYDCGEYRQHPKCLRCGRGFDSHATLESHRKLAHPIRWCPLCQKYAFAEDWEKHEAENEQQHPKPKAVHYCPVCRTSRDSEDDIKKHLFATHPELCCYTCGVSFQDTQHLPAHYRENNTHPKCMACDLGFRDSLQYLAHVADMHPVASPQSQTSLREVATARVHAPYDYTANACTVCDREYISQTALTEHMNTFHSIRAGPSRPNDVPYLDACASNLRAQSPQTSRYPVTATFASPPERIVPRSLATSAPVVQARSDEDYYSDSPDGSLVDVPRDLEARASSVPPSSISDNLQSRAFERAATPSEGWTNVQASTPDILSSVSTSPPDPMQPLSRASPSPMLVTEPEVTGQTISPVSSDTNSTSGYHSVSRIASPSRPVSRLSTFTAHRYISGNSPASESSSGLASPVSAKSLLFSLSQGIGRRLGSTKGSREPSPVQSPKLSRGSSPVSESTSGPATPASVHSVLVPKARCESSDVERPLETEHREHSVAGNGSSIRQTKPTPARESTTSSSDSQTRFEVGDRPKSPVQNVASSNTLGSSRWTCRVCSKEPMQPTTTMCGHLFCRSCIVAEISKNLQCPVCRTVMLVRLHLD